MKSTQTIYTEGALYVIIASGSPVAEFLISDRVISTRSLCAVAVVAIVAGANALKAFLSQSISNGQDETIKAQIVNEPGDPIPTEERPQ